MVQLSAVVQPHGNQAPWHSPAAIDSPSRRRLRRAARRWRGWDGAVEWGHRSGLEVHGGVRTKGSVRQWAAWSGIAGVGREWTAAEARKAQKKTRVQSHAGRVMGEA